MEKSIKISAPQLFIMLLISRLIVNITYSTYVINTNDMWEQIISCAVSFIITLIMVMPVYYLNKQYKYTSVLDRSYKSFKKFGSLLVICYAIYFLWVLCYSLSLFNLFVTDLMNPQISAVALSVAVIISSVYGAYKGVEAIARTSSLVFIFIIAVAIILIVSLFGQVESKNYTPLLQDGVRPIADGVIFMISKNSCIPVMAILLSKTNATHRQIKKGMFFWSFFVYGFSALIIYVTVGVLGQYLTTQLFPVYTVASVAQIGVLQRLDAVFLGVWTAGLFIKASLFIYIISLCIKRVWGDIQSKISIIISGLIILFVSYGASVFESLANVVFSNYIMLSFTILTAVIIPMVLIIKKRG